MKKKHFILKLSNEHGMKKLATARFSKRFSSLKYYINIDNLQKKCQLKKKWRIITYKITILLK